MKYIKGNWRFFVLIIVVCMIGGYYTTIYSLEYLDQNTIEEAIKQVGSKESLIIISVIQLPIITF